MREANLDHVVREGLLVEVTLTRALNDCGVS